MSTVIKIQDGLKVEDPIITDFIEKSRRLIGNIIQREIIDSKDITDIGTISRCKDKYLSLSYTLEFENGDCYTIIRSTDSDSINVFINDQLYKTYTWSELS